MKPLLFALLLITYFSCTAQEKMPGREIVFHSVNLIPMDAERVVPNQVVVVQGGKIKALGTTGTVPYSKDAMVINGAGKFLMPGLAEMHAHVPPVDDLEPMKEVLLLFAVNGVTTIRGMLGHPRHLELRNKIQSGEIPGPRFITSGPSFSGGSVTTPEAAVARVQEQKKAGYDFLKLHPGLTLPVFNAMVAAAKKEGIPFAGHVSFDVGVWRAIDAGYATIDHLDGFVESLVPGIEHTTEQQNGLFGLYLADRADTSRIDGLMKALRQQNIWVVPTQALAERWMTPTRTAEAFAAEPEMKYMAPATVKNWIAAKNNLANNPKYQPGAVNRFIALRRSLIAACNRYGVGLLLGSDAPQVFDVPGFSVHQELRYLVDAGLTPYQALRTGTVNVGAFLNHDSMGIIRTGAVADLILLTDNPLLNIDASRSIEGVLLGDRWLSKEWREKTLKKLEKQ